MRRLSVSHLVTEEFLCWLMISQEVNIKIHFDIWLLSNSHNQTYIGKPQNQLKPTRESKTSELFHYTKKRLIADTKTSTAKKNLQHNLLQSVSPIRIYL